VLRVEQVQVALRRRGRGQVAADHPGGVGHGDQVLHVGGVADELRAVGCRAVAARGGAGRGGSGLSQRDGQADSRQQSKAFQQKTMSVTRHFFLPHGKFTHGLD
jgi:hypothetical protein